MRSASSVVVPPVRVVVPEPEMALLISLAPWRVILPLLEIPDELEESIITLFSARVLPELTEAALAEFVILMLFKLSVAAEALFRLNPLSELKSKVEMLAPSFTPEIVREPSLVSPMALLTV